MSAPKGWLPAGLSPAGQRRRHCRYRLRRSLGSSLNPSPPNAPMVPDISWKQVPHGSGAVVAAPLVLRKAMDLNPWSLMRT